jgi:hypothetical protein
VHLSEIDVQALAAHPEGCVCKRCLLVARHLGPPSSRDEEHGHHHPPMSIDEMEHAETEEAFFDEEDCECRD